MLLEDSISPFNTQAAAGAISVGPRGDSLDTARLRSRTVTSLSLYTPRGYRRGRTRAAGGWRVAVASNLRVLCRLSPIVPRPKDLVEEGEALRKVARRLDVMPLVVLGAQLDAEPLH